MSSRRDEYRLIDVRPIAGALGAEIDGVDTSLPLEPDVFSEIHRAFLQYLVIVFRDQRLTPAQQLAFGRRFGEPVHYPQLKGLPECPQITAVVKLEHERVNFGGAWHTDTSYLECPPMASMLHAVEVPPRGGDTLFANQYMAFESLSEKLQNTLAGMAGISTSTKAASARTRVDRMRESGAELKILAAEHPTVRTHPETGRRSLYVNVGHTTQFGGWTQEESQPLLEYLFAHQVAPEFTARLQWGVGTLAMWDNRCTLHNPLNDYHGHRRVMHRLTLAGDRPC